MLFKMLCRNIKSSLKNAQTLLFHWICEYILTLEKEKEKLVLLFSFYFDNISNLIFANDGRLFFEPIA